MTGARYPGYDILKKRGTPSWNAADRRVMDQRLSAHPGPRAFDATQWETLKAVCARILPQPSGRPAVPIAAFVDEKVFDNRGDGWRHAGLPPLGQAWRRGLDALEAEAQALHGTAFHALEPAAQDELLMAAQTGELAHAAWGGMSCALFFRDRVLADVTHAYYAHPTALSEIGFGGPASVRGYVRMEYDRRDPWEASEARPGRERAAERENRDVGRR